MEIKEEYIHSEITSRIIACAIEVHRHLGPGMLESAYEECLSYELKESGFYVERQKPVPVIYKSILLEHGYRIDLLVDNKVLVELKTVESFTDVHEAQILTYLKFSRIKVGLLINFNVKLLKFGIKKYKL